MPGTQGKRRVEIPGAQGQPATLHLWLLELTDSGRVKIKRVHGEQNLAYHLTQAKTVVRN